MDLFQNIISGLLAGMLASLSYFYIFSIKKKWVNERKISRRIGSLKYNVDSLYKHIRNEECLRGLISERDIEYKKYNEIEEERLKYIKRFIKEIRDLIDEIYSEEKAESMFNSLYSSISCFNSAISVLKEKGNEEYKKPKLEGFEKLYCMAMNYLERAEREFCKSKSGFERFKINNEMFVIKHIRGLI